MTIESGVVENVGITTGISLISQSSPEIKRSSGYRSPFWFPVVGLRQAVVILVLDIVGIVTRTQAWSKMYR